MKKVLILTVLFCSISLVGCNNSNKKKESVSREATYEVQQKNEDLGYVEKIIAQYDKDGELKKLETYTEYPESPYFSCDEVFNENESIDLTYDDVKGSCTLENGSLKLHFSFTDKSIESGYLIDNENYVLPIVLVYNSFRDRTNADIHIEQLINSYKENNVECNEMNYIIINGKRKDW